MAEKRALANILVVDDEEDIVDLIALNLQREGYKVIPAYTGEDALRLIRTSKPDLVVLDLLLPGIEGLEVCREIRDTPEHAHTPIIILSARSAEVDRIVGLEMGADDYVTKPFSVRELVARIRAALRRVGDRSTPAAPPPRTFSTRDLFVDYDKHEVRVRGKEIELSPMEAKLLFFLTKNPGKVHTRDQLLSHVWGDGLFVHARTVDVHISHLRRLIENDPQEPTYIVTVYSVGYRFIDANL